MTLAKKHSLVLAIGVILYMSIGVGEVKGLTPVEVAVQTGVLSNYGDTMKAVPVYLTNIVGFDTIGGYLMTFNSSIPQMIDFRKTVGRSGSLSANFPTFVTAVEDDSLKLAGDYIKVVGIADQNSYILPGASALLFTLYLNIAADCELISDTNNAIIYIAPFISTVSDNHGNTIPLGTDADTLILIDGSVEVPGTLVLGDVNGSCRGIAGCSPSLGDAIHLVNYLFKGPANWPLCPPAAADVNCSGTQTLGDAIAIVNYIFKSIPFSGCL